LKVLYEILFRFKRYEKDKNDKNNKMIFKTFKSIIGEVVKVMLPCLLLVNALFHYNRFTFVIITIYGALVLIYYFTDWKTNKKVFVEIEQILSLNGDLSVEKKNYIKLLGFY